MSFRRLKDGTIEFQTLEDLLAYEQALRAPQAQSELKSKSAATLESEKSSIDQKAGQRWLKVQGTLRDQGLELLRILLEANATGISKIVLCNRLKIGGKGLGGVLGSITRKLGNEDLQLQDFVRAAGETYFAGPLLLELGLSKTKET